MLMLAYKVGGWVWKNAYVITRITEKEVLLKETNGQLVTKIVRQRENENHGEKENNYESGIRKSNSCVKKLIIHI